MDVFMGISVTRSESDLSPNQWTQVVTQSNLSRGWLQGGRNKNPHSLFNDAIFSPLLSRPTVCIVLALSFRSSLKSCYAVRADISMLHTLCLDSFCGALGVIRSLRCSDILDMTPPNREQCVQNRCSVTHESILYFNLNAQIHCG